MNHQPFRDWLLSDEKLNLEQSRAMQDHLEACDSCSQLAHAWLEVELSFRHSTQLGPTPGFTQRWQAHLEHHLQSRKKIRMLTSMAIILLPVIVMLVISASQVWAFIQSPGEYLAIWINSLLSLLSIYYAFGDEIRSMIGYLPIFTFIGMFFVVGLISFMSVLWLATYRKFSMVRRAT